MADASGFAALACDELLVHTSDIAAGLGVSFDPPREVCARVLGRLFPWAPRDQDPWEALRWANGHAPLGERPRLAPEWVAHPAPLQEWDGVDPTPPPDRWSGLRLGGPASLLPGLQAAVEVRQALIAEAAQAVACQRRASAGGAVQIVRAPGWNSSRW